MSFDIVWAPVDAASSLGKDLGADSSLALPHLIDDPLRHAPGGGLSATLNAKTLSLGILMTTDESAPGLYLSPSHQQLRIALQLAAKDLQSASEDDLCCNGSGYLREKHGPNAAVAGLQRAVELLPDSVLCRGDLITSLFMRATRTVQNAQADLEEAASVFLAWQCEATSLCSNEDVVYYCGLAALTYIDRLAERNQLIMSHKEILAHSQWLQKQLSHLHNARPWQIVDISLERQ